MAQGGGAAVHLAPATGGVIAIDDQFIYFLTVKLGPYGQLGKMPKTGGDVTVLANFEPGAGATAIAVDGTSVYWSCADGTIKKAPK